VSHDVEQPGALNRSKLRRVLWVFSLTQITSWGVLYYAFAVLLRPIAEDTGWSPVFLTASFSTGLIVSGLVGIAVGRRLDSHGPRAVMTAGSVAGVAAVVIVATASSQHVFLLGWVVAGVSMSAVLYPPAFAALTRWGGRRRVGALTALTLVAGFASTVFAPLAAWLEASVGWRSTYVVLALVLGAITIPLHWWGLDEPWHYDADSDSSSDDEARETTRTGPFIALGLAITIGAFVVYGAVINLVPMLVEQGLSTGQAAVALGIGGAGQVAGRLGYARLARWSSPVGRTAAVLALAAASTAFLAISASSFMLALLGSTIAGVARGLLTLVQATAVSDRWGTEHFGRLNGILTAPAMIAAALAPFGVSILAAASGGLAEAFFFLGAMCLVAAVLALRTQVVSQASSR
jgi:MFS family permease